MTRCDHCRPLIPDHLYGLLDGPEAAAVDAHLRECPACASARAEAARVQGLIAAAARGAFPQVRFEPPARPARTPSAALPTPKAPTATPARREPDARDPGPGLAGAGGRGPAQVAAVVSWAVAAAVLLAIPGTVVPVLGVLNKAESARAESARVGAQADAAVGVAAAAGAEVRQARADAVRRLAEAKQTHDGLLAKWVAEEKAVAQGLGARKVTVDVQKPAAVQPGAPNDFLLVVRDRGAAPGRLLAEVRDQTDAVVFAQRLDYERKGDTHALRLPADVWTRLTPQSELFLAVSSVDDKTGAKVELQDKVRLLGPVYATVLVTDKPAYRPGETVHFRSLTLDRVTFRPPPREQILEYELRGKSRQVRLGTVAGGTDLVRVVGDQVEPVVGPDGNPVRGVGTGAVALPADLDDGDYTLILRELPHPAGYPPAIPFPVSKPVKIRSGAADAYRKLTGYAAASYVPGDTVEAWAELKFGDRPVAGATVDAVVTADGARLPAAAQPATGPDGRAGVRFVLPRELDRADVRLKVTFKTPAGEESVADRVPVVGRNLIVEFFPEGGDLVAGVQSRVYVRATTPAGHPVDFRGVVTDGRKVLASVQSTTDPTEPGVNRGIGVFTYTPTLGAPAWLKLQAPAGAYAPLLDGPLPVVQAAAVGGPAVVAARTGFPLPKVKAEGVVMTLPDPDPITRPGQPVRVHLRSKGGERTLVVGAYTRGRLSDSKRVAVTGAPGEVAEVRLMAGADPRGGVVRVTVFEEPPAVDGAPDEPKPDLKPVAERLVFRRPGEALNLNFAVAGTRGTGPGNGFVAGSAVELDVTATDKEKGSPAAAVLYAAVVNAGVAPGPKDRLLTTHFLLAGEVSTPDAMEYADFLLTDHPRAGEALDLVLATQGWRRFAEQNPPSLVRRTAVQGSDGANLLVCNGQYATWAEPPGVRDHRKLYEAYWPRYEAAAKALTAAQAEASAAQADTSREERARELTEEATRARGAAADAARAAAAADAPVERFRKAGWFGVAGFGLLAALLGAAALLRANARLPLGIGTAGALGLVGFLVVTLGMADRVQATAATGDVAAAAKGAPVVAPPAPTVEAEVKAGRTEVGTRVTGVAPARPGSGGGLGGTAVVGEGAFAAGMPPGGPQAVAAADKPGLRTDTKPGPKFEPKSPRPDPTVGGGVGAGGGAPSPAAPVALPVAPPTAAKTTDNAMTFGHPNVRGGDARKLIDDAELPRQRDYLALAAPVERGAALKMAARDEAGFRGMVEKAKEYADARARALTARIDDAYAKQDAKGEYQAAAVPSAGKGAAAPADALALDRIRAAVPVATPLVVREYAAPRPGTGDAEARDEADTVLWQPVIVLPSDGRAKLNFHLGSAPGGYQVVIAGHTLDGRLGAVRGLIPVSPVAPATPGAP